MTAHVNMSLVDPRATCVTDMSLPAMNRFSMFLEYRHLRGMLYKSTLSLSDRSGFPHKSSGGLSFASIPPIVWISMNHPP